MGELPAQGALPVPIAQIEHANNVAFGGSNATGTERVIYFSADALATPRSARNAQGQELWRWASDGFGGTLPNEDVDGNGHKQIVNLRLPGQYFDGESGLHYNGFRSYDSSIRVAGGIWRVIRLGCKGA